MGEVYAGGKMEETLSNRSASTTSGILEMTFPHPLLERDWNLGLFHGGSTEPWTLDIIAAMVRAREPRYVLETGGFLGHGTAWIRLAMPDHGQLITVENNVEYCERSAILLRECCPGARYSTAICDAEMFIAASEKSSFDIAFIDDDHSAGHVVRELSVLMQKMCKGGLILMHDVFGPFGLDRVCRDFGGYCIDLPKLHIAGGLGFIQC